MSEESKDEIKVDPVEELEQRMEEIRGKLGEVLDSDDIGTTIVIFTHKDVEEPQVWRKGHFYDAAALLNEVLHAYKMKAAKDLGFQFFST